MQRSPPPHPYGRRDPGPTLPKQSPTSPAGFVLRLFFQEQAPQARGSSQKTLGIWPCTRSPFSKNGLGQLLAGRQGVGSQDRTGGDDSGLEKARKHSRDVCAPQGRVRRVHEASSRDQSSRGHPGTQRNQRRLLQPHHSPNSSNAGRRPNSGDHLLGDATPAPHSFYPNRPPLS